MCRSIKTLRGQEPPATYDDLHAAARQFVRKLSGFQKPSTANQEVFDKAIDEIAASAERMLDGLIVRGQKRSQPKAS